MSVPSEADYERARELLALAGINDHEVAVPAIAAEIASARLGWPREGDRVRLSYGDGSCVEGTWRAVLEKDDGTLHTHTRGQVRRDVIDRPLPRDAARLQDEAFSRALRKP